MAIPTTTNQDPLYVSREPAWELGVELVQNMQTSVWLGRAGLEQRQQLRSRGAYVLSYQTFDDRLTEQARWRRLLAEISTPLVVPFWSEGVTLASLVGDTATISRAATVDWFAVGDLIYLTDGTQAQFRSISGYGVSQQALELVSITGELAFAAGTKVYPCRLCVRERGDVERVSSGLDSHLEKSTFVTL